MTASVQTSISASSAGRGRYFLPRRSLLSLLMLLALTLPSIVVLGRAEAATITNSAPEFTSSQNWLAHRKPKPSEQSNQNKDDDDDRKEGNRGDDREGDKKGNRLSPAITNILRRDLAQRIGRPPGKIKVVEARRVRWSDTCLGLGGPAESCGLAIVEGWRVVLSANERRYVYRTDLTGQTYRLEQQRSTPDNNDSNLGNLPQELRLRVRQDAAQRTGRSLDVIRIIQAEQRTWSDGCLGLRREGEFCTQALVQGWRIVVMASETRLIYRTNASGSVMRVE